MERLARDLRHAARSLARERMLALTAVGTLALAIGGTTAVFSVVNGVLLRPLPFPEAHRLVFVWQHQRDVDTPHSPVSPPNYMDWRDRNTTFASMGALAEGWSTTLTGEGAAERLDAGIASADFFRTLGVDAALGRTFTANEDQPGGDPAAVLSHALWQRRFGGREDVLGRRVRLDGVPYTIVGVMPASFRVPEDRSEIYLSFGYLGNRLTFRFQRFLWVVGRMRPGVTLAQADADLSGVARALAEEYPDTNADVGVTTASLHDRFVGDVRVGLWMVLAAGVLVLCIGSANVASLLLMRAGRRAGELALRAALGAGRGRLIGELAMEGALLAAGAGVMGIGVAAATLRLVERFGPGSIPRLSEVGLDGRVLAFTAAISLGVAAVVGLVPAFTTSFDRVAERLKVGARAAGGSRRQVGFRYGLSVIEVGLTAVLLIVGGLIVRSYLELRRVDPGFVPEHVVTATVTLPTARYDSLGARHRFFASLLERAAGLPGVVGAGGISRVPILQTGMSTTIVIDDPAQPNGDGEIPDIGFYRVTADYFRTMGIPLLEGRPFAETDDLNAASAKVIVNEAFARRFFPGETAVGRRMRYAGSASDAWFEIVGVVGAVRRTGVAEEPEPEFFFHYLQSSATSFAIALRTVGDPLDVVASLRAALAELDPDLPLYEVHTMASIMRDAVSRERFTTFLLVTFGAIALVLAAVGVYGVIAVGVAQRTGEIAVRMAFGADRRRVLGMVVGSGIRLAGLAVALGIVAAVVLSRFVRSMLYNVGVLDPATYAAVAIGLLALAATAAYLPARRATRVQPMEMLRGE